MNSLTRAEGPPHISLDRCRWYHNKPSAPAIHLNSPTRAEGPPHLSLDRCRWYHNKPSAPAIHLNSLPRAEGPPHLSLDRCRWYHNKPSAPVIHLNSLTRAEGPPHTSLGRSPRAWYPHTKEGLKARLIVSSGAADPHPHAPGCPPWAKKPSSIPSSSDAARGSRL